MTILFCDMQGFTSFSEGMTPAALVTVLNRYLTVMSEPVRRNDGIIDKYIGDAIMAFWGQPFTAAEAQARLACLAALEQIAALAAFRAELPELIGIRRGMPKINVRIGIATGEVVVGNIGSEQTRNYTVIGDTVNIASRLEGGRKTYGTRILISEATQVLAADAGRDPRDRLGAGRRQERTASASSNCSAARARSRPNGSSCETLSPPHSPPTACRNGRRRRALVPRLPRDHPRGRAEQGLPRPYRGIPRGAAGRDWPGVWELKTK